MQVIIEKFKKKTTYLLNGLRMRGSRKFCQRGPTLTFYERATNGPPAKRHSNGVSLAGRWWPNTECWLVSFVVLQGIRTNNAKKPYIFVIGSGPPVSPSVSAHVYLFIHLH